jgi:hypothetical protein
VGTSSGGCHSGALGQWQGRGGTATGRRLGGIEGGRWIIVVIFVIVDGNSGGGNCGGVEGGRGEDGHRQCRTALRLLLPGEEGGRKCFHQGMGNIKC